MSLETPTYQIGLLGPSRIGKTSLMSTLLADGRVALTGTRVDLTVQDPPTRRRLQQHVNQVRASFEVGEFNPQSLKGNSDSFLYRMRLSLPTDDAQAMDIEVMDYPGGWLFEEHKQAIAVERFLEASSVLLVPVDATVVMEAVTRDQVYTARELLAVEEVADRVRRWAKGRARHRLEPAMLVLVPVKCESYLADSGAARDRSEELASRCHKWYEVLADCARREAPDAPLSIWYCPVDTMGCVELLSGEWTAPSDESPGGFTTHFGVRPPGEHRTRGMDDVLTLLFRHWITAAEHLAGADAEDAARGAAEAAARAGEDKGLLGNIWLALTGERSRRRDASESAETEAGVSEKRHGAISEVLADLGRRPTSDRLRQWA